MEISRVRKIFFILTWVSWISQFSKLIRWYSSDLCILLYVNLPPKIAWVRSHHSLIHNLLMALLSIQSKSQRPFSDLKISAWTTHPTPPTVCTAFCYFSDFIFGSSHCYFSPTTLPSLMLLEDPRHSSVSGRLHWLFPPPRMPFPACYFLPVSAHRGPPAIQNVILDSTLTPQHPLSLTYFKIKQDTC